MHSVFEACKIHPLFKIFYTLSRQPNLLRRTEKKSGKEMREKLFRVTFFFGSRVWYQLRGDGSNLEGQPFCCRPWQLSIFLPPFVLAKVKNAPAAYLRKCIGCFQFFSGRSKPRSSFILDDRSDKLWKFFDVSPEIYFAKKIASLWRTCFA